jgi:hypothetical protein
MEMQYFPKDRRKRNDYQTLFAQHGEDRRHAKVSSRAIGRACAGRAVVTVDLVGWNPVSLGQVPDKLSERSHLRTRGKTLIKISDQTNPHAIFIGPVTWRLAVRSCDLLMPSECDLYKPVWTVRAIANHKIIPHAFPMIDFSMPFIEDRHITIGRG